jgi:hypothetical protein
LHKRLRNEKAAIPNIKSNYVGTLGRENKGLRYADAEQQFSRGQP